jgi:hypothetical protein
MHVLPASLTRLQVSTATAFDSVHSAREYAHATTSAERRRSGSEAPKTTERDWIPRAFSLHDGLLDRTQLLETLNGKIREYS